ncbi:MAG: acyltransferase [Xanthomonadales bacterium]|nr:acyltransferase [Xanthomonadales bacterium]
MSASLARPHWAGMGESTFVFGIWLLYGVHRLLGRWPFRICLYPVVLLHWASRPVLRQASMQYLQRIEAATGALGRPPRGRDSLRHVALFAETLLDKLLAVAGRYPFAQVRVEGRERALATLSPGRGAVIVTAHLGCLELCRVLAGHYNAARLNILVHTRHAAQFNRLLKRLAPESDVNLIEVSEVNAATAVLLADKIDAGEHVVIAGDRVPVRASQTVHVDFLGHAAAFPVGPYVLASLLKCPLLLLGCIHEGASYCVSLQCLAERVVLPRARRTEALQEQARIYADALTRLLARSPFDWFNFFPFWDQHDAEPAR